MQHFEYTAPTTVEEAVRLLGEQGVRARALAGGTDLLVQLRETDLEIDRLVDLKRIPELTEVQATNAGVRIGAAAGCTRIYGNPDVAARYPGLVDAAHILGGWQIQSRASFGGNLCNGSPAADSTPILIAYHAECEIAGPAGRRRVPVEEFCTAPGKTVLETGELLVAIDVPAAPEHFGANYRRFIPRNEMDIAVVGCGVSVVLDASMQRIESGRIALGAVAPRPVLAAEASEFLAGKPADEATFAEAGEKAKSDIRPISDMRGPADYRVHLTGVLVKRCLLEATSRARGNPPKSIVPELAHA